MLPVFYCSTRRLLSSRVITSHCSVLNIKYSSNKSSPVKPTHPTQQQIQFVYDVLSYELPKCLSKAINPDIYANDIIFEDNIRNVKIIGRSNYLFEFSLMRLKSALLYAHVRVNILKMTQHVEEGTIKVRWNVQGVSNLLMLKKLFNPSFINFLFRPDESSENERVSVSLYDGFSIFYINGDGLVQKHLADKVSTFKRNLVKH